MFGMIWLAVFAPALFMPVVYILGRSMGKKVSWVAFIPLLLSTVYLVSLIPQVAEAPIVESIEWLPGIIFGMSVDSLSLPIVITVVLLSTIIVVYSNPYMEHSIHELYHHENNKAHATYYALYLAYVTSMMGVVLSTNLFEFYFFFELMIIPSWALINSYGTGEREKIALMYLLWSIVGAVIFVTGVLSVYALTHSFEIADLILLKGNPNALIIAVLMLVGLSVKLATFGLHIWLPFAHAEAPTPISALLSPAMIGLAGYGIVRLVIPIGVLGDITTFTLLWGFVTIVYGGLMVLAQTDIKRLLAYSSVSQMGYIFVGIASATTLGVSGAMMHYVSHGLGKAALFLTAGAIMHQTGIRDIRQLKGLADRMPISVVVFLIGCMNIAGIPPTIGFISKTLIFTGAIGNGVMMASTDFYVALISLISTALTVAYTFWTVRRIFFGPLPEHLKDVKEAPPMMIIPMVILCVISILVGLYPGLILDSMLTVIQSLVGV